MGFEEEYERAGIQHLFTSHPEAKAILPALYKSITKLNVANKSEKELIQKICNCGQSVYSILNKRGLNKDLLFDYLCQNNVPTANTTKIVLIETIVDFWKNKFQDTGPITAEPNVVINIVNNHTLISATTTVVQGDTEKPNPLQKMSEEFTSWLFEKINTASLDSIDLWSDVTSAVRLIDSATQDLQAEGSSEVLRSFLDLRNNFRFQFVPNICPVGVRGKMNTYGMVMIASCGCVHRSDQLVGTFEAIFGLLRDSQSPDVWKLKHSKLQINIIGGQATKPQLENCDSLQDFLSLPDDIDEKQMLCST